MGRQRTINESFWRSNRMSRRTVEDKFALLYFLTSPFSNITGAYEIVLSVAASEMGWDNDAQLMPVIRRLEDAGYLRFDTETQFIWVVDWWDHHSPTMALGPKLRGITIAEIASMPDSWHGEYITNLIDRIPASHEAHTVLASEFRYAIDRVSIPGERPIDSPTPNTTTTLNSISNPTTTNNDIHNLHLGTHLKQSEETELLKLLEGLETSDAQELIDELIARLPDIKTTAAHYLAGLVKKKRAGKFTLTKGLGVAESRNRPTDTLASQPTSYKKPDKGYVEHFLQKMKEAPHQKRLLKQ